MKKIFGISLLYSAMSFTACGNEAAAKKEEPMQVEATTQKTYPTSLVNNKKDPTCGMPVTAGISDTLHYEKYVLGFCAEGCKDEAKKGLKKNPKTILAAAEINIPVTRK
jgi:hypothetical protein